MERLQRTGDGSSICGRELIKMHSVKTEDAMRGPLSMILKDGKTMLFLENVTNNDSGKVEEQIGGCGVVKRSLAPKIQNGIPTSLRAASISLQPSIGLWGC